MEVHCFYYIGREEEWLQLSMDFSDQEKGFWEMTERRSGK